MIKFITIKMLWVIVIILPIILFYDVFYKWSLLLLAFSLGVHFTETVYGLEIVERCEQRERGVDPIW